MSTEQRIRILLADEHRLIRAGLRTLLADYPDLCMVGDAASSATAVQLCAALEPDVIVTDLMACPRTGIHTIRVMNDMCPQVSIVVYSAQFAQTVVYDAIRAGAISFLSQDAPIDELVEAIRAAHHHRQSMLSQRVAAALVTATQQAGQAALLTEREQQVLALMVEGLNNIAIAQRLVISRSTVKKHISHIFHKLNTRTRTETVAYAFQNGLLASR
jgi:NarL family two-component system response regulator LiaR